MVTEYLTPADAMTCLRPEMHHLDGVLGQRLLLVCKAHLKSIDYRALVDYFRHRPNRFAEREFWGKTVRAACLILRQVHDIELRELLRDTIADLLSTQEANGCISAQTSDRQPQSSDIWECKYVMLGLLEWYELTRDKLVLAALTRMADHLLTQVGPGTPCRIADTGWDFAGIESNSILEPMMLLYQTTGQMRYLTFARTIVEFEGACKRGSIFSAILSGVAPKDICSANLPKERIAEAYKFMSCLEGLMEYARATGDKRWAKAVIAYQRAVRQHEITILGSSGGEGPANCGPGRDEQWNGLALDQAEPQPCLMGETCVTVTWMQLCLQVLRLTGDPAVADDIERSLYNALLGAMRPDGRAWDYFQPLNGRRGSIDNFGADIAGFRLSCCTANGPMALAILPKLAVMAGAFGPVFNLYLPGTTALDLPCGGWADLVVTTAYPSASRIHIVVQPDRPRRFAVSIRIPAWSANTRLIINDVAQAAVPGTYARIERLWHPGDTIELNLDLRCRAVHDPRGCHIAVERGPLVLARDRRLGGDLNAEVNLPVDDSGIVAAREVTPVVAAQVQVLVTDRAGHEIAFIDYASAGATWNDDSWLRVWMPVFSAPR